jgi:protein phosphatase
MSLCQQISPSIYHRLSFGSVYGLSDVGLVRRTNEDNFLIDAALGLVAVADGMGGHEGGELAAWYALTELRDFLASTDHDHTLRNGVSDAVDPDATWHDQHMPAVLEVHQAVAQANARVYGANLLNANIDGAGMGTTLTGFWHRHAHGPLIVFHIGDSRLYRYREGELTVLTRDQTLYQQALEAGAATDLPPRNMLLQAIGPAPQVVPEVKVVTPAPGDLYLLCTDGLYGNAPHAAIARLLALATAQSLDHCCAELVELAKVHGSRDNITAVLALCES